MKNLIDRLMEIETIPLGHGSHERRDRGVCVMEAAAYVAGEAHTDEPTCVCPVIGAFLRTWNDKLPSDAERDRLLKPLLTRILDSRSTPAVEEARSYLALDWLVRVHTPAFLRLRPELREHADALSGLAPLRGITDALAAKGVVAAWDAAGDAAGDAAWDAAGDALAPTVAALQSSALDLVERMLKVEG